MKILARHVVIAMRLTTKGALRLDEKDNLTELVVGLVGSCFQEAQKDQKGLGFTYNCVYFAVSIAVKESTVPINTFLKDRKTLVICHANIPKSR